MISGTQLVPGQALNNTQSYLDNVCYTARLRTEDHNNCVKVRLFRPVLKKTVFKKKFLGFKVFMFLSFFFVF